MTPATPTPTARTFLVAGFVILLVAGAPIAAGAEGQVIGSPSLELFLPEDRVEPGEATTLEVHVVNDGRLTRGGPAEYVERVTTARATTLEFEDADGPITVTTGRIPVGSVPEGTQGPYAVEVEVDEDAAPGTYRLPVRVRYTYTRVASFDDGDVDYDDASYNRVQFLTVTVVDRARFAVTGASSNVSVGGTGTLVLSVANVGTSPARDATVTVESSDPDLRFGGGTATARSYVGDWGADETRTLRYRVAVDSAAIARSTALAVTVSFTDRAGVRRTSDELSAGITPRPEQRFAVGAVRGDLRVGADGRLSGRVENRGPGPARDAVLVLTGVEQGLIPAQREYPLGTLGVGEAASFSVPITVTNTTRPGPRRFTAVVDYGTTDGERARSDPLGIRADVRPVRDEFVLEPVNATFTVDSSGRLRIRVTNALDEPVTNIHAEATVEDPLESDDPRAFVARLGPGETAAIDFSLTVTDDAIPKTHAIPVVFSYETAEGSTRVSDPYLVPIDVEAEPGAGSSTLALGGIAVALLLAGVWWWYRR